MIEYGSNMAQTACPKCHLPKDDSAWQCDGCGYAFRTDFPQVRAELQTALRKSRVAFWLTVVLDLALAGGVIYLAMHGWYYICVGLAIAAFGWTGHAVHRISVLRDHLASLDRRHAPLPTATAHRLPESPSS